MGYRTTFVTEDKYQAVPNWFYEKYKEIIQFGEHKRAWDNPVDEPAFPLASKWERKFYLGAEDELFIDLARVMQELDEKYSQTLSVVLMHEDGEIDRVLITPQKITLQRSLHYDPDDDYNPQLGSSEEYIIPKERDNG